MFELVADIESYDQFVPGCRDVRILSRSGDGAAEDLVAEMQVGHRLLSERFVSRVHLNRPDLTIHVEDVSGPLSHLENSWRFADVAENRCQIDFRIDFTLKSRALSLMAGALFDRAFLKLVEAFEARADELYQAAG